MLVFVVAIFCLLHATLCVSEQNDTVQTAVEPEKQELNIPGFGGAGAAFPGFGSGAGLDFSKILDSWKKLFPGIGGASGSSFPGFGGGSFPGFGGASGGGFPGFGGLSGGGLPGFGGGSIPGFGGGSSGGGLPGFGGGNIPGLGTGGGLGGLFGGGGGTGGLGGLFGGGAGGSSGSVPGVSGDWFKGFNKFAGAPAAGRRRK